MATFNLEIITPQKVAYNEQVEMVITRTVEGDMAVLANHAPLVTELAVGEMKIKREGKEEKYFIAGGFLEVSQNKTIILADRVINAENINIETARREKELYEAKLTKLTEDRDIASTQKALNEALTQIRIGEGM